MTSLNGPIDAPADLVNRACHNAAEVMGLTRLEAIETSSQLLLALADALLDNGDELVAITHTETHLPQDRLTAELSRTVNQLRFMAQHVIEMPQFVVGFGASTDVVGSVRRVQVPIGPVAVFAASNFPFAFGVLGGDTASALAAGCSAVIKGHPAQPLLTNSLRQLVTGVLDSLGVPAGRITVVDGDVRLGTDLVSHHHIAGVGFTGSFEGGKALMATIAQRPTPIVFHAEMGSVNPVIVSAGAAQERGHAIASALADSVINRAGQLCTKPNVVFVPITHLKTFAAVVAQRCTDAPTQHMLYPAIADRFAEQLRHWNSSQLEWIIAPVVEQGGERVGSVGSVRPGVAVLSGENSVALAPTTESFGPACVIVGYTEFPTDAIATWPGSLSASIYCEPTETLWAVTVSQALSRIVGRLCWNTMPTGVDVVDEQHHGGPWPATNLPAATAIGAHAVQRWTRPVSIGGQ